MLIVILKQFSIKFDKVDYVFFLTISIIFLASLILLSLAGKKKKKVESQEIGGADNSPFTSSKVIGIDLLIKAEYGISEVNQKLTEESLRASLLDEKRKKELAGKRKAEGMEESGDDEVSENPELYAMLTDLSSERELMAIMDNSYMEAIMEEMEAEKASEEERAPGFNHVIPNDRRAASGRFRTLGKAMKEGILDEARRKVERVREERRDRMAEEVGNSFQYVEEPSVFEDGFSDSSLSGLDNL